MPVATVDEVHDREAGLPGGQVDVQTVLVVGAAGDVGHVLVHGHVLRRTALRNGETTRRHDEGEQGREGARRAAAIHARQKRRCGFRLPTLLPTAWA